MTRPVCCAGTTRTAAVDGISAAGADAEATARTPSADAEMLVYGRPVRAPVVPVSPTGCPTPALVTRAVLARLGVDRTVVDAGLPMAAVREAVRETSDALLAGTGREAPEP